MLAYLTLFTLAGLVGLFTFDLLPAESPLLSLSMDTITLVCLAILPLLGVILGITLSPYISKLLAWFDKPDPNFHQNIKQDLPTPPGAFPALTENERFLVTSLIELEKELETSRQEATAAKRDLESVKKEAALAKKDLDAANKDIERRTSEAKTAFDCLADNVEQNNKAFEENTKSMKERMNREVEEKTKDIKKQMADQMEMMQANMKGMKRDPRLVTREAIQDNVNLLQNLTEHQKENARLFKEHKEMKDTLGPVKEANTWLEARVRNLEKRLSEADPVRLRAKLFEEVWRDDFNRHVVPRDVKIAALQKSLASANDALRFW